MDPGLLARRADLRRLAALVAADPARHAALALALRREGALLASAPDLPTYLQRSDHGFELARAAWLDRQAVLLQVALDLDDPMAAEAAAAALAPALAATGQRDWVGSLQQGAAAQAHWQARAAQAHHGLQRAVMSLLLYLGGEPWQGDPRGDAAEAWRSATEADPSLAEAVRAGALQHHPLAACLPWRGAALARLQAALSDLPAAAAAAAAPRSAARVQAVARSGWQAWRDLLGPGPATGGTPPADLVAPDPVTDLTEAALAALQTPASPAWAEPLVQAHLRLAGAALAAARTELQVLQTITHAQAAFAVEAGWQSLLACAATLPLRALAAVALLGEGMRAGLARAVDLAYALCGLGPRALLAQPELQRRLTQHWVPHLTGRVDAGAVGTGQAGADLLPALVAWLAMRAAQQGLAADMLCADLGAALRQHLDELQVPEPVSVEVEFCLWGQAGTLASWPAWMAQPPRPPSREPATGPL